MQLLNFYCAKHLIHSIFKCPKSRATQSLSKKKLVYERKIDILFSEL